MGWQKQRKKEGMEQLMYREVLALDRACEQETELLAERAMRSALSRGVMDK